MLTYQDCVGLSDLTDEKIEAIAQHEHLPEIVAAELGSYLVHDAVGVPMHKRIILDDIQEAEHRDDRHKAIRLKLVFKTLYRDSP